MPVEVPFTAKSRLKSITPIIPQIVNKKPAQKRLLFKSGLSSGKKINEKPAIHKIEDFDNTIIKPGLI